MSLSEDLKKAAARMQKQKAEEQKRSTGKRRSSGTSTGSSRNTTWTREDELVALYLWMAGSSKFLKENYATKRNMSVGAMQRRIDLFEGIRRAEVRQLPQDTSVTEQTNDIYRRYGKLNVDDLNAMVISILRGEFQENPTTASTPTPEPTPTPED